MARETSGKISNSGNIGNINQGGTQNVTGGFRFAGNSVGREAPGEDPGARDGTGEISPEQDGEFPVDRSRNVFVVYGRDEQARQAVFGLLRRLDLRPLEWEPLVRGGKEGVAPFLGQVVADAPAQAQAAVVVLTPDDTVMLHPQLRSAREERFELYPALQPRPNVLIELGIVLAVYPKNTIIVEFGQLRPIADLAGRNVIRFHEGTSVAETVRKIAGRLEEAGCPVDDSGADWLDPGAFMDMNAYRRKPQ
jgi:predicted nucleotide-binding protein